MSESLQEQVVDVGGGDIPVTADDLRLFEAPDPKVSPSPEPKDQARSEQAADVKQHADDGDGEQDERFTQSQNRARRERQKQARERQDQRLREQDQKIARLEQIIAQGQVHSVAQTAESLQRQFNTIGTQYNAAEARLENAISNSDGPAARAANADILAAVEAAKTVQAKQAQIASQQERLRQPQAQPQHQQQQTVPDVHPEAAEHGMGFMQEHRWYNIAGTDPDSVAVNILDAQVAKEGFDPRTQEYWDELASRVRRRLPHQFENGKANGNGAEPRRRGPPVSGSTAAGGRSTPNDSLTPRRIEAMKQGGIWDDDERRKKAIEEYRQYDLEHGRARDGR